jgi:D-serine dehydratase
LIAELFEETKPSQGIIESALMDVPAYKSRLEEYTGKGIPGKIMVKADHGLPIAGSIKARGGIYEVLCYAEELALEQGVLKLEDHYCKLAEPTARELFSQYTMSVGSTGNLGLSIGVTAAALGFRACVHMSAEAKEWKKDRLRKRGVTVVEHQGNYGEAVKAGRKEAEVDPYIYFVDDENSIKLFLGYSVAALRLKEQFTKAGITIDQEHPLMVYLPCGVGGAPGGIAWGLKHVFGDAVHCFFAEPVQAPCFQLGLITGFTEPVSVYDIGLKNTTEADGLAVGTASKLAGKLVKNLVSGCYTVTDDDLFRQVVLLKDTEGIQVEPSAAAGCLGPVLLASNSDQKIASPDLTIHLIWTTGGSLVPDTEYITFYSRGKSLL